MSRERLHAIFVDEGERLLADAARILEQTAAPSPAELAELFRVLHSVKGMAASMGFEALVAEAHAAEELLAAAQSGDPPAADRLRHDLGARVAALRAAVAGSGEATPADAPARRLPGVRIEPDQLDRLLELALRISTAVERLEHRLGPPAEPALLSLRESLARDTRELRREVLELRLAPLRWLVPTLDQALRRWAGERGVLAALDVRGDAVRVDRMILEGLVDPLGHLLRNAVVHGIEPPGERRAAGKPERGRVVIEARRDGQALRVEVRDDGRGLEPRAVLERAAARGLIPPGTPANALPGDVLDLLARPGMSGRGTVDALGGRGVGLSAVRAAVERLGGELRLSAHPGRGFTARLQLPVRLALVDVFLVEAAGQRFAVPLAAAREVREPATLPAGAARVDLGEALGLGAGRGGSQSAALAVDNAREPYFLVADRVLGSREVVVRPLGPPLDQVPPWTGAALLAEGGIALVLDPSRLR
ncbi:MAG: Hpt domain-containing protein [Acidobacteria bacterium]|nr:Hpt domain-containing protein [Acidobacteriota bacterium]